MVSGLADLEIASDGSGGQASGGTGGSVGAGGSSAASCLGSWETSACRGQCGDPGDGVDAGCGNFMDCFVEHQCLPAACSDNIDEVCGVNHVEGGNSDSLDMAEGVVTCLCYPPPP